MTNSFARLLIGSSLAATLGACSGGGSGGSGGSSSTQASGAFSVPNLNCGNAACFSSSTRLVELGMNSGEEIADYGERIYRHFNTEALPQVNTLLYRVEQAFKRNEIETCADILEIPVDSGHDLGEGYEAFVSAGSKTSPFGGTTAKDILIKQAEIPVMQLSVGCSGTLRYFYVKAIVNDSTRYEVWTTTDSADSAVKSVEAAADVDGSMLTLQFKSTTASEFTLAAAGKNYPDPYTPGAFIDFSIFGQANLGSVDKVKIAYSSSSTTAPPTSFSAVDTNWSGSSIAHCYSDFSEWIVDGSGAACSSLTATSPTTSGVRGHSSSIQWRVDDFDDVIPGIIL